MGDIIPTLDNRKGTVTGILVGIQNGGTIITTRIKTDDGELVDVHGDRRMVQMALTGRQPDCRVTVENLNTSEEAIFFDRDE